MKKISYILLLFICASCSDLLEDIDFDVTLNSSNTYKVGDPVQFDFVGNPDYISFYSGEEGYNYDYINRTEAETTGLNAYLEFDATVERQTTQTLNALKILFSSDFSGLSGDFETDSIKIMQTNWIDKSDECNFSSDRNVTVPVKLNVTEFLGTNTCVAFRYEGYVAGQPKWIISNIRITMQYADGKEFTGMSPANMGFIPIDLYNRNNNPYLSSTALGRWDTSNPGVSLVMTNTSTGQTDNLDYAISSPLLFNEVVPDKGIGIKDMRDRLAAYSYQFNQAGKYNVTFVAKNLTIDGEKSIVKKVDIEIKE